MGTSIHDIRHAGANERLCEFATGGSMKPKLLRTEPPCTVVAKRVLPRLQASSRQVEAEVVSNSNNKTHQTWEALFWRPLWVPTRWAYNINPVIVASLIKTRNPFECSWCKQASECVYHQYRAALKEPSHFIYLLQAEGRNFSTSYLHNLGTFF